MGQEVHWCFICMPSTRYFSPNKNASEWELKLPVHCSAERISRRSERQIFKEGKISMKNWVPDHPVVTLDNETGATARLCRACHSDVTSRCQASSECHLDLSRNAFVFLQFPCSYFTFSRTKSANRAKAFQSDNSSVSGWQRVRFLQCNSVKPTSGCTH